MDEGHEWRRDADQILAFAIRWAPFGGGDPYDIYSNFGIDESVFFTRIIDVLSTVPLRAGLDELARQRLLDVAQHRLTLTKPTRTTPATTRL